MEALKRIARKIVGVFPWQVHYFITYSRVKRFPNLFRPQNYSVYVFRDNILGRHNKHAYLADKYEVRKFVEERGYGNTLTKLYGVWDDANDIDFTKLPNEFALKCNHSCGMNIIVYDKSTLDLDKTRKQLNEWLKMKHPVFFEQHYEHIKPRIICEELIHNDVSGFFPMDYKIHCANGVPVYIQCCFDRTPTDPGRRVIYSTEWKDLHYVLQDSHYSDEQVARPKHLDEMLEMASKLSKGLEYARIDLYDTDKGVLFGEVTLSPMGGWFDYFTPEALNVMGDAIRKYNK